jgi:hypothetical protein
LPATFPPATFPPATFPSTKSPSATATFLDELPIMLLVVDPMPQG